MQFMRRNREHLLPRRGARWRRYVAALVAVLFAFHGVLAFAGTGAAFTDPEICRSQPADSGDGAAKGSHQHQGCLLCLPGCSTLAAGDVAFAAAPLAPASAALALAGPQPVRAERRHAPYRPRGPPA